MDIARLKTTVQGKDVFEDLHNGTDVQVCSQLDSSGSATSARIDGSTGMLEIKVDNGGANEYASISPEEVESIAKDLSRFNSSSTQLNEELQSKDRDKAPEFMRMTSLVDFDGRVVAKKLDFNVDSPGSKSTSSLGPDDDETLDSDQVDLMWDNDQFEVEASSAEYPWTPLKPMNERKIPSRFQPTTETFAYTLRALFGSFLKSEQSVQRIESAINELREACDFQNAADEEMLVFQNDAVNQALESSSYRIAELKGWIRAVENGKRPGLLPDEFDSPDLYQEWKKNELSELKQILSDVSARPQHELYLQLHIQNAENLKTKGLTCTRVLCCCLFRTSPLDRMGADPYAKISLENSGKMKIISKKQAGLGAQETNPNPNISNDHDNESDIVKGSLNPEWNCCWELYMMKKPDQIKVKVRDADLPAMSKLCVPQNCFFNGRTMGEVSVPVSSIPSLYQAGEDQALDLKRRGKTAGKIHFSARRISFLRHRSQPKRLDLIAVPSSTKTCYESLVLRKCPEQILDCIAEHYRIRPVIRTVAEARSILSFQLEVPLSLDLLKSLVDVLERLCRDILDNQLTKKEKIISEDLFKDVSNFISDAFSNYKKIFVDESDVQEGFKQLMLLMDLERRVKPKTPNNSILIRKWVLRSIVKRSKKVIDDKRGHSFTASTFTRILEEIEAEVLEDYLTYSNAMPKEVDVGRTSLRVHYDDFRSHLEIWLNSSPAPLFNKDFIEMITKLREFHTLIDSNHWVFSGNRIHIDNFIEGFLVDWFDGLRAQIIIWVRKTLNFDNWQPLSQKTGVRYAQSLVDVFSILSQFVDESIERLSLMDNPSIRLFYLLDESLYGALKVYAIRLQSKILECLQGIHSEEKGVADGKSLLSPHLCTLLSTLYAIPFHIEDLLSSIPILCAKKWSAPKLDSLISRLSEDIVEILSVVSDQVRKRLKANITDYLEAGRKHVAGLKLEKITDREVQEIGFSTKLPEELRNSNGNVDVILDSVWSMIEQLKTSFSTMNEYLEPKVFLYCLFQLWNLFLSVFEEQISNQDVDPEPCTAEERDLLFRIFMPVLWNLFSQGLEEQLMIESSRKLSTLILSSRKDTIKLVQTFWKLWDEQREDDAPEGAIDETIESPSSSKKGDFRSSLSLPTLENVKNSKEQKLTPLDILRLLNQRVNDDEAVDFVNGQINLVENYGLSILFNWQSTEDINAKFNAKSSLGKEGIIYVTKNYIAFSSLLSLHSSANDNTKLLRITEMASARRVEKTVTILTRNREGHIFTLETDEMADKLLGMIADRTHTSLKKAIEDHRKANPVSAPKSYFGFRHRRQKSESNTPKNNLLLAQEIPNSNGSKTGPEKPLLVFSCMKRGIIHYRPGVLTVQPGLTTFVKAFNGKRYSIAHHLVSSIQVVKIGIRDEGISIHYKPDGKIELTKFDPPKPIQEICDSLRRLILP